jgi:hypothetical protein
MQRRFRALLFLTFLTLWPLAMSLCAQTIEPTAKPLASPKYDISKEVTLTATVSNVIGQATSEMKMLAGSHLILETASGKIDASLGVFPFTGEGVRSIAAGERVQVTGVMKIVRDQRVLITRLVLVDGREYKVRNEHGFLLMPVTRKVNGNSETKRGQL